MFEKEAEYYAKEKYSPNTDPFIIAVADDAFKDGAEFGYNKANEWHYVKDGDLPRDDKQCLVLFYYTYRGKKEMSCGVRDNLHSDFEIHRCYTEQIIAWKEIVLPKESE